MNTLTVKIPEKIDAALKRAARIGRRSKSELVRSALERYLANTPAAHKGSALDLAGDLAGCVEGQQDSATNPRYLDGFGQ